MLEYPFDNTKKLYFWKQKKTKNKKKQKAEALFCEANLIGTVTKIVLVNIICFVIYIKSFHYFCIYTRLH